jgi:hypothetical protein
MSTSLENNDENAIDPIEIAEESRARCNSLTPEQRKEGLERALKIIYKDTNLSRLIDCQDPVAAKLWDEIQECGVDGGEATSSAIENFENHVNGDFGRDALRKEIQRYRDSEGFVAKNTTDLVDERARLRARIIELEQTIENYKNTLIAHPDTIRLDWLESNPDSGVNTLSHRPPHERVHVYIESGDYKEGEDGILSVKYDHFYAPTVREAIDAAIDGKASLKTNVVRSVKK